eukprot:403341095
MDMSNQQQYLDDAKSQSSGGKMLKTLNKFNNQRDSADAKSQLSMIHETMSSHSRTHDNSIIPQGNQRDSGISQINNFENNKLNNNQQTDNYRNGNIYIQDLDVTQNFKQNQDSQSTKSQGFNQLLNPFQNQVNQNKSYYFPPTFESKQSNRISTTIKLLNDKEKFIYARKHRNVDLLLELIQSNDSVTRSGSMIDMNTSSQMYHHPSHNYTQQLSNRQSGDMKSLITNPGNEYEMRIDLNASTQNIPNQNHGLDTSMTSQANLIQGQQKDSSPIYRSSQYQRIQQQMASPRSKNMNLTQENSFSRFQNQMQNSSSNTLRQQMTSQNHNSGHSRTNSQINSTYNGIVSGACFGSNGELRSDLRKEWMDPEYLVSHCALNQLTHLILQKRKEVKLHKFYNLPELYVKQRDLVQLRQKIVSHFQEQNAFDKRMKKYQLMADEVGIQSSLFLLLVLAEDEVKGINFQEDVIQKIKNEQKSSISSLESLEKLGKAQSILSSGSKKNKKHQDKESQKALNTGWFKRNINKILDLLDQVLSDQMLGQVPFRITIILFKNLRVISKSITNSYIKKRVTYKKLQSFFDRERDNMSELELIELEDSLKHFYSKRELYSFTKRRQHVAKLKDVYLQQLQGYDSAKINKITRLIRSDSTESLIEQIQTDKQFQSMLIQNQLDTSKCDDTNSNYIRNSYEFKIMAEEGGAPGSYGNDKRISPDGSGSQRDMEIKFGIQSSSSVGPDTQNQLMKAMSKNNEQSKRDKFLGNTSLESRNNMMSEISSSTNQDFQKTKLGYYQQFLNSKYQSIYSKKHPDTFSNLKDSRMGESPVDQTFLEMKESLLLKDRSFYQKLKLDQSREESKNVMYGPQGGTIMGESMSTFTKNSSPINSQFQKFDSQNNKILRKQESSLSGFETNKLPINYTSLGATFKADAQFLQRKLSNETQDYETVDLKTLLQRSDQSTQLGTRHFTSNGKGNTKSIIKSSQNKLDQTVAQQSSFCCVCLPGSNSNSNNKKSKKNNKRKDSSAAGGIMNTKQSEEFNLQEAKMSTDSYQKLAIIMEDEQNTDNLRIRQSKNSQNNNQNGNNRQEYNQIYESVTFKAKSNKNNKESSSSLQYQQQYSSSQLRVNNTIFKSTKNTQSQLEQENQNLNQNISQKQSQLSQSEHGDVKYCKQHNQVVRVGSQKIQCQKCTQYEIEKHETKEKIKECLIF